MTQKSNNSQNGNDMGAKVAMGVGLAALAAATAGAVFLYGTDAGKKKRKQIKGWMLKAKGEVLEQMENMKDLSEDAYTAVVDSVAKKYESMKDVDPVEVAALVRDLKSYWNVIKRQVEGKSNNKRRKSTSTRSAGSKKKSSK